MERVLNTEKIDQFKKLFLCANTPIIITYALFITYRIHAFTYYMMIGDFITYACFVFISSQVLCVIISALSLLGVCLAEKFGHTDRAFEIALTIILYSGYSVSLFAFAFSMERVFIDQSVLDGIGITPVVRAAGEMLIGVTIFVLMLIRGATSYRAQAVNKTTTTDLDADVAEKRLNRRIFLASSASALATATVGSRLVAGNQFEMPIQGRRDGLKNILLITFDALSATDMSCYGYGLNTTPNIDLFANSADVYRNFYACSTYTTPAIATILTGRYPSSSGIYHLAGMLHDQNIYRTLPALLKSAGYETTAVFGNPYAMPLMGSTHGAFDHLCAAPRAGWTGIAPSELQELPGMMDMIDLGTRVGTVSGLVVPAFRQMFSETPPHETFEVAKTLVSKADSPFFLWIHVMAPHAPYLPSEEFRYRFLPQGVLETRQDMLHPRIVNKTKSKSQIQADIENVRLRYNEWISEADDAFGKFMSFMDKSGRMGETMTMVSADHGEFFAPNTYGHSGGTFHKSLINVPMIIKEAGQHTGRQLATVADQTAIAPTILKAAGIEQPIWMQGSPLRSAQTIIGEPFESANLAVTQYFVRNSKFEPITKGTIGAVSSDYQYVRNISTGEEKLFSLREVSSGNELEGARTDVKNDIPYELHHLKHALTAKFPEVMLTGAKNG